MKWLTKTEIERRAKKSYKESLLVSIEHHQQIANATCVEFFTAVGRRKVNISSDYCGLCQSMSGDSCKDCLLKETYDNGCGSNWKNINKAIGEILTESGPWSAVVKAEKNMIKVLKKELKKQKGD